MINVKSIAAAVAMVPHSPFPGESVQRFFAVEKPGLDVAWLGGVTEEVIDDD